MIDHREQRRFVRDLIRPTFALGGPTYLLDLNFRFLDWNPAFYEFCARPLGLTIGSHVQNFVSRLKNGRESIDRAMKVFAVGTAPVTDTETLVLDSKKYGEIRMQKTAAQIYDLAGQPAAWVVHLNIRDSARAEDLFADLANILARETLWSIFGLLFDNLEQRSARAREAAARLVDSARGAHRVLCIGLTTPWEADQLRRRNPEGEISICIPYAGVRESLTRIQDEASLTLLPNSIDDFGTLLEASFDAVLSFGGLMDSQSPPATGEGIRRVLSKGGRFACLAPRANFNILDWLNPLEPSRRNSDPDLQPRFAEVWRRLLTYFPPPALNGWPDHLRKAGLTVEDSNLAGALQMITGTKP